jgi:hypothetical protein
MFIEVWIPNYSELSDNKYRRICEYVEKQLSYERSGSYSLRNGAELSVQVSGCDDDEWESISSDIIRTIDFIINDSCEE